MSKDSVNACPECDTADLYFRPGGNNARQKPTRWQCRKCAAEFDTPKRRAPKQDCPPSGLAGKLYHADPEDLGL